MKPFHIQFQHTPDGTGVLCRWFGASATRAEGALTLARAPEAETATVTADFAIDLAPLLAEIAVGRIADAEALATADEFLPLRDLLEADRFAALREALYSSSGGRPFASEDGGARQSSWPVERQS